jgi:hypothetical protein
MKQGKYTLMKRTTEHKNGFWVRLFLMIFMGLTSFGGWAQGYTVIYPDGQTMANPGDVVTVVFDEDASEYYYNLDRYQEYCFRSDSIERHTVVISFLWWELNSYLTYKKGSIENSPGDCAGDYVKLTDIEGLSLGNDNYSVEVTVPNPCSTAVYDFYYGKKSETKVIADGQSQDSGFLTKYPKTEDEDQVKKWTTSFTPKGVVRIDVVTDNLALRSPNSCYCPGDVVTLEVANNSYGDNLIWSYACGD